MRPHLLVAVTLQNISGEIESELTKRGSVTTSLWRSIWRLIRCTKRIEQGFSIGSRRTTESRSRLFRISLTRIALWNYTTEFTKTFRTTSGLFIWQSHSFQTSTSRAFNKNRLRWPTLEPQLSQLDRLPLVTCEPIAKNGEVDEANHLVGLLACPKGCADTEFWHWTNECSSPSWSSFPSSWQSNRSSLFMT